MCPCSGPVALLRLELGVLSRGCVGTVELVCEYLQLGHVDKVTDGSEYIIPATQCTMS